MHKRLAREYQDMNGSHYEILNGAPTAIRFSQIAHISRPVLFQECDLDICDFSDDMLTSLLGGKAVSIAVTPDGRADAIAKHLDGIEYFVEPHVEEMTLHHFFKKLSLASGSLPPFERQVAIDARPGTEVYYLQSQNGNIYVKSSDSSETEFSELQRHVPKNIPWVTEALGRDPDAVNIWIGDERSVTCAHCDPYENLYLVLRGAKHFTLFPPTESWCFEESHFPPARYTRSSLHGDLCLTPSPSPSRPVRWTTNGDLSKPMPASHRIEISVQEGEMLYLPVGWWHHVRQTGDETGKCVALNWWYDAELRGMHGIMLQFLRELGGPPVVPLTDDSDDQSYLSD